MDSSCSAGIGPRRAVTPQREREREREREGQRETERERERETLKMLMLIGRSWVLWTGGKDLL